MSWLQDVPEAVEPAAPGNGLDPDPSADRPIEPVEPVDLVDQVGAGHPPGAEPAPPAGGPVPIGPQPVEINPGRLGQVDLTQRLSGDAEAKALARAQRRLLHLRLVNGGIVGDGRLGPPLCIVFEGWDAAGKGGAIKRLVSPIDPRHVRVAQFGAPTRDELRHHFLWRFFPALPGWGGMAIFDRSWYGRILVERVENLVEPPVWQRAYDEIASFERSLADEGMTFVKLWMHISHDEQLRRFEARRDDPLKGWKLTDEDWRNRAKRPEYEAAVEDMLARTDTPDAPWDVIAAEQKRFGRVAVLETVIARIEAGMRRWGIEPPAPHGHELDG